MTHRLGSIRTYDAGCRCHNCSITGELVGSIDRANLFSPHGTVERYDGMCRCVPCRDAARPRYEALRAQRRKRDGLSEEPIPPHGRYTQYQRGCRCEHCTAANTAEYHRQTANRRRMVEAGDPSVPHGKVSTYRNWRCRCGPCTEANARQSAKWRADHPGYDEAHRSESSRSRRRLGNPLPSA